MAKENRTAREIVTILSEKLKHFRNKIRIEIPDGYAGSSSRKTITQVIIRGDDRIDSLEIVSDILNDARIKFEEKIVTGSSFTGITISDFVKFNKEREIRILFKFLSGRDSVRTYIWNEMLENHIFTTKRELRRMPSDANELNIIKLINQKIQQVGNGTPISVRIGRKTYQNVVGFVGGKGTTKSDFVIINSSGEEIGFLSFKIGTLPIDFQQYSGISKRSGYVINSHPEVQEFTENVIDVWDSLSSDYDTLYRKIEDRNLKKSAVFGKDFRKPSGYDSVDFLVQGDPRFSVRGKTLNITFSTKNVRKNDLSGLSGDYDPHLGVRKGEQTRRISIDNENVSKELRGVRGGIWTKGYLSSRKKGKEI